MLSVEEVTLLLRAATAPKYKAAFATAYGAGLRVSEVVALKVGDIDSKRMLLRVERGKGGKDRAPVKPFPHSRATGVDGRGARVVRSPSRTGDNRYKARQSHKEEPP